MQKEKSNKTGRIGIIGGTGVYDLQLLEDSKQVKIHTPYGKTSDLITTGTFKGREVAIIPRHGSSHTINPSNVNSRANIHALKELGVTHILAPSAVGSLKQEIKPGDFVFTDQFIDRTRGRKSSFYEGSQVCHISMAEPFCPELRKLLISQASTLNFSHHPKGTAIIMEGPRFSTKAESALYRSWQADIIGMTLVPESVLAREAEICYAPIAMVTDYDVWKETAVSVDEILQTMKANVEKVKKLLEQVLPKIPEERVCECKDALKGALV